MVLSRLPLTSILPMNARLHTNVPWPDDNVALSLPWLTVHTRIVVSVYPLANSVPSSEKATTKMAFE